MEEFWKQHPMRNKIHLVEEEQLLGTGGTVKRNIEFFNQRLISSYMLTIIVMTISLA